MKLDFKKAITWILGKKYFLLMALFLIAVLAILFQKSCGGGYESKKYLELKGKFTAHQASAEQKEIELKAVEAIVTEQNTSLLDKVDRLEIEKGQILADTADRNKKIFEQDLELKDLRKKETEITDINELVLNLRAQIFKLKSNFSLAIEDRDKYKAALSTSETQILDLKLVILNQEDLEKSLRDSLAAKDMALKACEGLIKVGEKNTIFNRIGKLAGKGFQLYGMYSAGRDILKGAKL